VSGELQVVEPPVRFLIFNLWQTIWIGGQSQTIWFPRTTARQTLADARRPADARGIRGRPVVSKGQGPGETRISAGDHLFVDRLTCNFHKPDRGEIVVFSNQGGIQHPMMPQDQFYIKRLVALPGDRVQIGDDRHLIINGRRLDASTPHFETVYSFDPRQPPHESEFSGHLNGTTAVRYNIPPGLTSRRCFQTPERFIRTNWWSSGWMAVKGKIASCMVMGDNTCNSFGLACLGTVSGGQYHRQILLRLLAHHQTVRLGEPITCARQNERREQRNGW